MIEQACVRNPSVSQSASSRIVYYNIAFRLEGMLYHTVRCTWRRAWSQTLKISGAASTGLQRSVSSTASVSRSCVGRFSPYYSPRMGQWVRTTSWIELRATRKAAAPPTIYRALDFLRTQGLIHRIERLNAFIPCPDAGQRAHPVQFLICQRCGAVDELDNREIVAAIKRAAARRGFLPGLASLDVEGTCSKCSLGPS